MSQAGVIDPSIAETQALLKRIEMARQSQRPAGTTVNQIQTGGTKSHPFSNLGHFMSQVAGFARGYTGGDMPPQMKSWRQSVDTKAAGLNETFLADGGVLVPPEFSQQLMQRAYQNDLLSRTMMLPLVNSNTLKVPAIDETSRQDGSRFGGIRSYWEDEGGQISRSRPSFQQIALEANKLTLLVPATEELLMDSAVVALETYLNQLAVAELDFRIGDAIINGNGHRKPLGIMNSGATITVTPETGQTAGTIMAANVLKMWSRLHLSCQQNAVWLVDQSTWPQLAQMTIGTAGSNLTVYQPPGGLSAAPYATLLGKPVIPVEFCQQVGTRGDIILADLSSILSISKGSVQSVSSMHVLFETAEMLFRFIIRLDAQPWWKTPLTPKSGGSTQSCFVVLETRS